MTRRPLQAAATLCATLTLAACTGSPKAAQPNTAPPSTTPSATVTPSDPAWTEEEQAAITAAKARYAAARAAIDKALRTPQNATRSDLEKAGNGGNWIITVLDDLNFKRQNGWYEDGKVQVVSMTATTVTLTGQQRRVSLTVCLDTSKTSLRFIANNKPVPTGPGNGTRHKAEAALVFAPPVGKTDKMWFLIDEKATGTC